MEIMFDYDDEYLDLYHLNEKMARVNDVMDNISRHFVNIETINEQNVILKKLVESIGIIRIRIEKRYIDTVNQILSQIYGQLTTQNVVLHGFVCFEKRVPKKFYELYYEENLDYTNYYIKRPNSKEELVNEFLEYIKEYGYFEYKGISLPCRLIFSMAEEYENMRTFMSFDQFNGDNSITTNIHFVQKEKIKRPKK